MTPEQEQECRAEADRLKPLDVATQRQIIDLHRSVAADRKVKKHDREEARQRAAALEKFLGPHWPLRRTTELPP